MSLLYEREFRDDVAFSFVYQLLGNETYVRCADQAGSNLAEKRLCRDYSLEKAFISKKIAPDLAIGIGKKKAPYGGWEQKQDAYQAIWISPYAHSQGPYDRSEPVVEIGDARLKLIVLNDLTTEYPGRGVFGNTHRDPSYAVESHLAWNQWGVLLQGGVYDHTRSHYLSVGLLASDEWFKATLDLSYDYRLQKFLQQGETILTPKQLYNMVGETEVEASKYFTPFAKLVYFNVRGPVSEKAGVSEREANLVHFDDNARMILVGVGSKFLVPSLFIYSAFLQIDSRDATKDGSTNSSARENFFQIGLRGTSRSQMRDKPIPPPVN